MEYAVFDDVDAEVVGHTASEEEPIGLASDAMRRIRRGNGGRVERTDGLSVAPRYGIGLNDGYVEAASERVIAIVNVLSYCEEAVTHPFPLLSTFGGKTATYTDAVKPGCGTGNPVGRSNRSSGRLSGSPCSGRPRGRSLAVRFDFDYLVYGSHPDEKDVADEDVETVEFETL